MLIGVEALNNIVIEGLHRWLLTKIDIIPIIISFCVFPSPLVGEGQGKGESHRDSFRKSQVSGKEIESGCATTLPSIPSRQGRGKMEIANGNP